MQTHIYRKTFFHLSLFGIMGSILVGLYDVIFDFTLEGLHLIIEMIEASLDSLIEHIFHTEMRETQIIAFYILLAIGLCVGYLAYKVLVRLGRSLSHVLRDDWTELKTVVSSDWQGLSVTNKMLWITGFLIINCLVFFLFS